MGRMVSNAVQSPLLRGMQDSLNLFTQPGNLRVGKRLTFTYDVSHDLFTPFYIADLSVGTIVSSTKWSVLVSINQVAFAATDYLSSVDVTGNALGQGANFVVQRWKPFQQLTGVGAVHIPFEKIVIPPGCTQQGSANFAGISGMVAIAESFGLAIGLLAK